MQPYLNHPLVSYVLTDRRVIPLIDWANSDMTKIRIRLRSGLRFPDTSVALRKHTEDFASNVLAVMTGLERVEYCHCFICRQDLAMAVLHDEDIKQFSIEEWAECLKKSQK